MSFSTQYDPIYRNEWPINRYEYNGFSIDNGEAVKTVNINGDGYLIRVVFVNTEKNPITQASINKELDSYTTQRCSEIVNVALDIGLGKETSTKTADKRKPKEKVMKSVRFNFANPLSPIAYKEYENKTTKVVNASNYLAKLNPLIDESKRSRFERLYKWFTEEEKVGLEKKREQLKASATKRAETRAKLKSKNSPQTLAPPSSEPGPKNIPPAVSSQAAPNPVRKKDKKVGSVLSHKETMAKIDSLEKMMADTLEKGKKQLKTSTEKQ